MIRNIHQSSLNMAFRCGEQFRRRYIEGHIIPPSISMGTGTAIHKGANENFKHKIIKGEDLPLDAVLDAARDGFVNAFKDGIFIPDQGKKKEDVLNDGLNTAIRLSTLFRKDIAPSIMPVATEKYFEVQIPEVSLPLAGTMDLETETGIEDFKTAGKSWSEGQIRKETQPFFYGIAKNALTGVQPSFKYIVLVDLKTPKIQEQFLTSQEVMQGKTMLINKLQAFMQMLQTGTFLPAIPSAWWCSPDWCGYYRTCKFVM
jgi:hypothetical protein